MNKTTNMNILYNNQRLAEALETLDQLHSAASEGTVNRMTTLNQRELVALLEDLIYTAQETIREMDTRQQTQVILQFVEKAVSGKRQA